MFLTRMLAAAVLCLGLSPAQAKHAARPAKAEPTGRVVASVYWEGNHAATGRTFDPNGMTVAHRTLPFGTRLIVSYGSNVAEVVVGDRGPFVRGREIDLSRGVARALHFSGVGTVRVVYWPPLPSPRPVELLEVSTKEKE
jgi:rare lipoprotein A